MTLRSVNYSLFALQMLVVLALAFLLLWSLPNEHVVRAIPVVLFLICIAWCEMSPETTGPHKVKSDQEFWSDLGVSMGVEIKAKPKTPDDSHRVSGGAAHHHEPATSSSAAPSRSSDSSSSNHHGSVRKVKELEWLAESAYRDGHYVEAYFWALKAHYNGSHTMTRTLAKYCSEWVRHGKPDERDNVRDEFSAHSGSFARCVLRIQCGIHPHKSLARIHELAHAGHKESIQYLHRHVKR